MKESEGGKPEAITAEIFRYWFNSGESESITWKTLIHYLRVSRLNSVADDIESRFNADPEDTMTHSMESNGIKKVDRSVSTRSDGRHPINRLKDLTSAVQDIGDWEGLCINLEVAESVMSELRYTAGPGSRKKLRCLHAYFNTGESTWEELIHAVIEHPIGNKRVAKKIANEQGIDLNALIKDEL